MNTVFTSKFNGVFFNNIKISLSTPIVSPARNKKLKLEKQTFTNRDTKHV